MSTETVDIAEAVDVAAAKEAPAHEEIAARAYEIHLSGDGGDELENWLRAERELSSEQGYYLEEHDADEPDDT
jgi:hypothetical protein